MDKLRIGIIGGGYWGPNLIRNFNENPKSEVTYICDVDPNRLQVLESRYPGIARTTNVDVVFGAKDVDAVVISTPTSTHFSLSQKALLNGKHVFVEKPLTDSTDEARELVELAQQKNLKIMVGHTFVFNPGVQYLKRALENHDLGRLHYIYFVRTNLGPIRADVNAWWDLASHDVAMLLYLLGANPLSVTARGASFINPPIEDVVFANFRYANGVFANIHASWLDPRKVRQVVLVGSQRMLLFDDMNLEHPVKVFDKGVGTDVSKLQVNDNIQLFRKSIFEGTCSTPELPKLEPLRTECEAFVDWLCINKPQPSHGKFGLEVVRVLEAASHSIRHDGKVQTLSGENGFPLGTMPLKSGRTQVNADAPSLA